jgi:hypothetical protein
LGPLGSGWGPRTVANVPVITAPLRSLACFTPQAVGQYPATKDRHKQWRREYAARVAAVEASGSLRGLLDALGPRTTRETWRSFVHAFSTLWLGCRESTRAAADDYNYALEWLIRALGYALERGPARALRPRVRAARRSNRTGAPSRFSDGPDLEQLAKDAPRKSGNSRSTGKP